MCKKNLFIILIKNKLNYIFLKIKVFLKNLKKK